jgi:hypothetical protein
MVVRKVASPADGVVTAEAAEIPDTQGTALHWEEADYIPDACMAAADDHTG